MLTEEQVEQFCRDGFLNSGLRVLSDDQVGALRARLDAVMEGRAAGRPEALRNLAGGDLRASRVVVQIVNIWEADDLFRALLVNPVILGATAQLAGADTLRVWHDQVQYKPPRVGTALPWHQDYPAWPVLDPPDLVSCWVALDDATLENGCLRMVPGSHRWGVHRGLHTLEGFAPGHDPDQVPAGATVEAVPCVVKAGCAMFHHCLTWHGSAANPSERPRRAKAVHYMQGYTRFVPAGRHLIDNRIEAAPGEILAGRYFPTVLDAGAPVLPEAILVPVENEGAPREELGTGY